jgi:hypothetical protein
MELGQVSADRLELGRGWIRTWERIIKPTILEKGSRPVHQVGHTSRVYRWTFTPHNSPVVIGDRPGRRSRIVSKPRD